MAKQSYNIILNSVNGIGATNTNKTYYFDFNLISDNKPYEMTFSFISKANTLPSFSIPMVYVDLGQTYTYEAKSNSGGNISKCIGTLIPNQLVASPNLTFLLANYSNTPVYLDKLHSLSSINVSILNELGTAWLDANATPADIGSYVLTLHLTPIK
jgi:hypothetical protein